jgi:hypothetical protein
MIPTYYALPDYASLVALVEQPINGATRTSDKVFSVGYSFIDFWVDVDLDGATPITSMTLSFISEIEASGYTISPNDDLHRTDSNTIVVGAYTSSPYIGTIGLVPGHARFLVTAPAAGWATQLKVVFNSADPASTIAILANRRL